MVENPQLTALIARDLEGEALSTADRLQLNNGYMELLRSWESSHYQFERGALPENLWIGYSNYAADILANNKPVEEYWRQRLDYSSPRFNEFIESKITERRAQ
jgi:hypothetical protein